MSKPKKTPPEVVNPWGLYLISCPMVDQDEEQGLPPGTYITSATTPLQCFSSKAEAEEAARKMAAPTPLRANVDKASNGQFVMLDGALWSFDVKHFSYASR